MATDKQMININGKEYEFDALSETVKAQIQNIQFAKMELERLQRQHGLIVTAMNSYEKILLENLPPIE